MCPKTVPRLNTALLFYWIVLWKSDEDATLQLEVANAGNSEEKGVGVPTGFEPVFEFDYNFAIYYRWFRKFFPNPVRFFIF